MNLEMADYPSEPSAITKVITKSEAGKSEVRRMQRVRRRKRQARAEE